MSLKKSEIDIRTSMQELLTMWQSFQRHLACRLPKEQHIATCERSPPVGFDVKGAPAALGNRRWKADKIGGAGSRYEVTEMKTGYEGKQPILKRPINQ